MGFVGIAHGFPNCHRLHFPHYRLVGLVEWESRARVSIEGGSWGTHKFRRVCLRLAVIQEPRKWQEYSFGFLIIPLQTWSLNTPV